MASTVFTRQSETGQSIRYASALAIALILGIAVGWSPRFWSVAVLLSAVLLVSAAALYSMPVRRLFLEQIPVAAVCAWGWLQILFRVSVRPELTQIKALEWTCGGFLFFAACRVLRSTGARSRFFDILLTATAIFSLLAVFQNYSSPDKVFGIFPAEPGTVGTFLYKNQFAAMLELTIPIALWRLLSGRQVTFYGVAVLACLLGGVPISASRAGAVLVALEVVVILAIALKKGRVTPKFFLLLMTASVLCTTAVLLIVGYDSIVARFHEAHPYLLREELLKSSMKMWQEHPIVGTGLGTWSVVYPRFATFDLGVYANAAHNDWAEWMQEGGLMFALPILAFCLLLIRPALQCGWAVGLVAVMFHSWVDYPTREPVVLMLWFCLAGAAVAQNDREAPVMKEQKAA